MAKVKAIGVVGGGDDTGELNSIICGNVRAAFNAASLGTFGATFESVP